MDWLLELLKFATSGFWTFIGTCIVLGIIGTTIVEGISAIGRWFKNTKS